MARDPGAFPAGRGARLRPRLAGRPPDADRRPRPTARCTRPGRCSPPSPRGRSGSGSGCSSRATRSAIPSILAKQAVTVDHVSGGRLILGLGAGWHADEHRRYGIDLPPPAERVDRLEEAIQMLDRADGRRADDLRGSPLPARRRAARTQAGPATADPAAHRRAPAADDPAGGPLRRPVGHVPGACRDGDGRRHHDGRRAGGRLRRGVPRRRPRSGRDPPVDLDRGRRRT